MTNPRSFVVKTVIGYGAPNAAGGHQCHGAALGHEEIAATRENLNWSHGPFDIPTEFYDAWDGKEKGQQLQNAWNQQFNAYKDKYPQLALELERRLSGKIARRLAQ